MIFSNQFACNIHYYCRRAPPRIPTVHLPEEPIRQFASALTIEINRGFAALRAIGSGRDLKTFLIVYILQTSYFINAH